ncbi:hypothetical protein ACQR0Z_00695 [Bradyrhizobium sp. HKCCYLS3077]|uniref:hypothetical protein n=1 Tax=Bradyrhizobium sp. HKCCYLS3077 TaxID=3420761 RepID=UPI003EC070D3
MSDASAVPPSAELKTQLTKKLPTFRAGFTKQLEALRAYSLLSEGGKKPVSYKAIAEVIKIHEANVSSMNPFFLENGFIEKSGTAYVPTAPVLEYFRRQGWDASTAAQALAPIIVNSWFGIALTQRLHFRSLPEEDALSLLAARCQANPEAKPQLRLLIDYCEAAGVVIRTDGKLSNVPQVPLEETAKQSYAPIPTEPEPIESPAPPPRVAPRQTSTEARHGAINFQIAVDVDLAEMRDWTPERIAAFFSGIAQVIAAKNRDT